MDSVLFGFLRIWIFFATYGDVNVVEFFKEIIFFVFKAKSFFLFYSF